MGEQQLLAIAATAVCSSLLTWLVAALWWKLRLQRQLEARLDALGETLEQRVRNGVLSAGEELAPAFRGEVEQGFRKALIAVASGEDIDDSVRAMARNSMDLVNSGLSALLGREARRKGE